MNADNSNGRPLTAVLGAYLSNYVPVNEDSATPPILLNTTEDIVAELSDMVEAEPGAVAALMVEAGYKAVFRPDGRHGWAMRPKAQVTKTSR